MNFAISLSLSRHTTADSKLKLTNYMLNCHKLSLIRPFLRSEEENVEKLISLLCVCPLFKQAREEEQEKKFFSLSLAPLFVHVN